MRIGEGTLVGAALAFGLRRPDAEEARRRSAAHGHLAEEFLAWLIVKDRVFAEENGVASKLSALAERHRATAATIRTQEGDLSAERLWQVEEADRLSRIVAEATARGDGMVPSMRPSAPAAPVERRQSGAWAEAPIDRFTAAVQPELPQ